MGPCAEPGYESSLTSKVGVDAWAGLPSCGCLGGSISSVSPKLFECFFGKDKALLDALLNRLFHECGLVGVAGVGRPLEAADWTVGGVCGILEKVA